MRGDLEGEGISILLPQSPDGDSGFCIVMVEADGERTFITSPGVESQVGTRKLSGIDLGPSDAVFVSGYDLGYPALGSEIARWSGRLAPDVLLIVDPGPLVADIPSDILDAALSRTSILTLNRPEPMQFAGTDNVEGTAPEVLPRIPTDALLILREEPACSVLLVAGLHAT